MTGKRQIQTGIGGSTIVVMLISANWSTPVAFSTSFTKVVTSVVLQLDGMHAASVIIALVGNTRFEVPLIGASQGLKSLNFGHFEFQKMWTWLPLWMLTLNEQKCVTQFYFARISSWLFAFRGNTQFCTQTSLWKIGQEKNWAAIGTNKANI